MTTALALILAGIGLFAASGAAGLPGACSSGRGRSQRRAALLMVAGGLTGLAGALYHLAAGSDLRIQWAWGLPGTRLGLHLDALAAWFLVPVFLLPALSAVYGVGYRPAGDRPSGSRRLDLSQGLLAAAMGLVVLAGDGLTFLLAWEAMALAAWLAATVDDSTEVREAGWVYLVATHAGTLCLFALFALWEKGTGSLLLVPAPGLMYHARASCWGWPCWGSGSRRA
jgi:hydrogenase-4 component B